MDKVLKELWGQKYELAVEDDCFDDEKVLPIQDEAIRMLLKKWDAVEDSSKVVASYLADEFEDEQVREEALRGCLTPKYLYAVRNEEARTVALMCDCDFDPEHGIAVVFENEQPSEIGPQDIVL